jgi:mxaC protein
MSPAMPLEIEHARVLLALPLCLLPWLGRPAAAIRYSALMLIPRDRLSAGMETALRLAGTALIAALVLGLSGPFLPARPIERIGEGAQIVLLLDRSRSMDQPFGGQPFGDNPLDTRAFESKGTVARRVLARFVAGRRSDQYALLVFSAQPIQVLPLTDKTEPIQAAITAGNVGRGLTDTDVGGGILAAAQLFDKRPYTGSRLVLLISDGGARLDLAMRERIAALLEHNRVALYWIYISSRNSPGLGAAAERRAWDETAPARTLHAFFETLQTPYRVFDAEDPDALAMAIAEVNRLQSLPIRTIDLVPRQDVARVCFAVALALLCALALVELLERKRWAG